MAQFIPPGILQQGVDSLLTNLVAWWSMNEASGTRVNSVSPGTIDLTDNNTVMSIAGKVGNAATFAAAAANEWLSAPSHANLVMGDNAFTVAGWLFPITGGDASGIVIRKGAPASAGGEWALSRTATTGLMSYRVRNAANSTSVLADIGSILNSVWGFFLIEHDPTGDVIAGEVNRGTRVTAALAGGSFIGNSALAIGGDTGGAVELKGHMDEVAIWRRLLTTPEKDRLYNSGNGMAYPG